MTKMDGKVAIVTGGTQGLGAAIAELFAQRGASGIFICGRSLQKGEAIATRLTQDYKTTVIFAETDLGKVDDCRSLVAKADAQFGRVDVLVNAAGQTDRGTIVDTAPELLDSIFAVNLRAPFVLMQDAIKIMRRERIAGSIVNICSMSSTAGEPYLAAYCASKGALVTLTRNTAHAVSYDRIRVNGLNIGWMASEGEDRVQREYHAADADWVAKASASQPFGRLIEPEEVARAVAFLACDESGMMTGALVNFDQTVCGAYGDPLGRPE